MSGAASAPASAANLGPGFDCIALALALRCSVTAEPADDWSIRSNGEQCDEDASAFVRSAVVAVTDETQFHIEIESEVPRQSGLGSSAAVAAATAAAVMRSGNREPDRERVFRLVADLDGHADNAAASVYGELVAVVDRTVLTLDLSPDLVVVVAVPTDRLPTSEARRALPVTVTHAAATRSVARVVALVEGLRTGLRSPLAAAAGDELHEAPRSVLAPVARDLIAAATGGGALHASWSGAGPSVVALTHGGERAAVANALEAVLDGNGTVLTPDIDHGGLL